MSTFAANITGSDANWYKRIGELEATFEQMKTATAFFTFSYPDHHLHDLHRLMPGPPAEGKAQKYRNLMNNPHLVDWFFSYRLNEFLKVVFDDILDCEWRWHRYEWQSRSSIHAHGAVKFKNDPDLVKLTTEVYISRLAEKKLENGDYNSETKQHLENEVKKGKESEEIIINYTDTLITAMNPRTQQAESCVPDPHPCSLKTSNIDENKLDDDYNDLINCCQRHVCRINGYCKSKQVARCRFTYPFDLQEKTKIYFIETQNTVKAEINLMRNDQFMNMHNRLVCHNWRGNVDMQIILDKSAAINYMVKYATNGEKAGQALCQIFKEVIGPSSLEDNPTTKIRSLMIKSIAGKRDIGQCEVSRLLLSEPLYNSSFNYVTLSTEIDSRELNLNVNQDEESSVIKNSLIDYFANRKNCQYLDKNLPQINCLIKFVKFFKLDSKNKLVNRPDNEKTVVITLPKIRYNPDNSEQLKSYCFHQMIKFSDWDITNLNEIRNKETAIERWNNFLKTAPEDIIEMIGFNNELSKQLKAARKEIEIEPEITLTKDQWMILSEIGPNLIDEDDFYDDIIPDNTYDFLSHRKKYTTEQCELIENRWIDQQKKLFSEKTEILNETTDVNKDDLNSEQKLAFKIVENYQKLNKQLLLIINGTAGTGKSFTIKAISDFLKSNLGLLYLNIIDIEISISITFNIN
ncbi:unnamed protein product [Brachionus calyciflorus]|uniref:Helitron helicase-like domain-containing protein n=1 Tax=Brachionus calyciflorus TaxID=104777 RepID=A0A814K0L9_9BILA|nr:unnamed protein product [Brachionus calyciflorus]